MKSFGRKITCMTNADIKIQVCMVQGSVLDTGDLYFSLGWFWSWHLSLHTYFDIFCFDFILKSSKIIFSEWTNKQIRVFMEAPTWSLKIWQPNKFRPLWYWHSSALCFFFFVGLSRKQRDKLPLKGSYRPKRTFL